MSGRARCRPPKTLAVGLAGLAFLVTGAPRATAQAPRVLIVGPIDSYGALVAGVSEGLQAAGFHDASRIRVDVRNAGSGDEAKVAVGAALAEGVDVIVTIFGPSTQAARSATATVPIVFCPVADPVAARFAASAQAPGGNMTGVASADAEASRRRLAAFRQVLPDLRRLAVLFDPDFPPDRVQLANLEQMAPAAGITLLARAAADGAAAVAALQALGPGEAEAVVVLKEAILRRSFEEVGRVTLSRKLPIFAGDPDLVTLPGVIAAVGPSQRPMGKLCGQMTARILNGARAASQPVEHPELELLINVKAAASLGVVVPERALEQAARVIRE
jgi:ABC-type uncharacterized transport system substrate-binding protein